MKNRNKAGRKLILIVCFILVLLGIHMLVIEPSVITHTTETFDYTQAQ